jgi:ketosteroid isomerase-like protein
MKFILTFLLTLSISVAFAQAEKEVETAIQNLKTAMLAEDADALRNLTSPNLTYGHSSGVIENQAEFLAVFAAKKTDYQKWEISDQTITFHGKDLAIVRHRVKAEIAGANGQINKLDIGLLMIWTKEKGSWKLLARQAFRLSV